VRTYILALFIVTTLSACVPPSMYQWGNYENGLYKSYQDPNQTEALRIDLESHIKDLESLQQKIPPGLCAELGTLYFQKGDSNTAKFYYAKERDTWPESRGLMTSMIQNIERRQKPPEKDAQ
jgi:hypothetical protein